MHTPRLFMLLKIGSEMTDALAAVIAAVVTGGFSLAGIITAAILAKNKTRAMRARDKLIAFAPDIEEEPKALLDIMMRVAHMVRENGLAGREGIAAIREDILRIREDCLDKKD